MPIKKPGKRPFAPWLQDHRALGKGHKRAAGAADVILTPLIDMFVLLVVFLIMNFSATGELVTISKEIKLPKAKQTKTLERSPIIQISAATIAVEGIKVGDADELLKDADLRIPELTEKLQEMRKVEEMMNPGKPFKAQVIINCDQDVDFKLVRKVMSAAAEAGYINFNYAVLQTGSAGKEGEETKAAEG